MVINLYNHIDWLFCDGMYKEMGPRKNSNNGKIYTNLNTILSQSPKYNLTDKDYKFLSYAEKVSRKSDNSRHMVGCIIVESGDILSYGFNTSKTHPFQAKWNSRSPHLHAEMMALIDALKKDFNPKRSVIYVSRYGRNGLLGCSYPCIHCWNALEYVGLTNIVCYDENSNPVKIML